MESMGLENADENKDNKQFEYNAKSKLNDEAVDINVSISSKLDSQGKDSEEKNKNMLERIEAIEKKITDVESADVYKIIDKLQEV